MHSRISSRFEDEQCRITVDDLPRLIDMTHPHPHNDDQHTAAANTAAGRNKKQTKSRKAVLFLEISIAVLLLVVILWYVDLEATVNTITGGDLRYVLVTGLAVRRLRLARNFLPCGRRHGS